MTETAKRFGAKGLVHRRSSPAVGHEPILKFLGDIRGAPAATAGANR